MPINVQFGLLQWNQISINDQFWLSIKISQFLIEIWNFLPYNTILSDFNIKNQSNWFNSYQLIRFQYFGSKFWSKSDFYWLAKGPLASGFQTQILSEYRTGVSRILNMSGFWASRFQTITVMYLEWLGVLVTRNWPLEGLDPPLVTTQSRCWSCFPLPFKFRCGVEDVSGELSRIKLVWLLKEPRDVFSSLVVAFDRFLKCFDKNKGPFVN